MGKRSARKLWTDKLQGKATSRAKTAAVLSGGARFKGIVLGIDPSLRGTGVSVVNYLDQDQTELLYSKTLKFKPAISMDACLGGISTEVCEVLGRFDVAHVAIEETIYVNNFRTAQIMGASRGAAVGAAAMNAKPVYEYSPLSIKKAVVGTGRASKAQVAGMVAQILKLKEELSADESDASAVALCHAMNWRDK